MVNNDVYSSLYHQSSQTSQPNITTRKSAKSGSRGSKFVTFFEHSGGKKRSSVPGVNSSMVWGGPIQRISIDNSHHYNMPITIQHAPHPARSELSAPLKESEASESRFDRQEENMQT